MRALSSIVAICLIAIAVSSTPAMAAGSESELAAGPDLGHQTLPANDGWASLGAGTTGGSLAAPEQIYVVHTRAEFIAALNNGVPATTSPSNPSNEPKIIYVDGTIDFNVDDSNQPLTCVDYYRNGFTIEAFLATYDPAVWGRVAPSGPLENARIASRDAQQARVRMRVGSNTTIVGMGKNALLRGIFLDLRGTSGVAGSRSNIIIRNITFRDTFDCFPQWAPTDGALGSWNAQYDSIALRDTDHVWVDHNTFEDRDTADELQPLYFGVIFQVHDGLLDITNNSDLVTASWNIFHHHDKTMLIGSSDSATGDRGKLRVTLHHNLFLENGQRVPRVRFGQVHVYNNFYVVPHPETFVYSWGVGIESAIFAQNNFFLVDRSITPDRFITRLNGTAIHEEGTFVNGVRPSNRVDVLAAYNAVNDPDLSGDVGWTPTLHTQILPTQVVPVLVALGAGPFHSGFAFNVPSDLKAQ
jgi:pectate lyase